MCLCFLLNISLETWAEFSESKIKNTKLSSLRGGTAAGTETAAERQNCTHPDGEIKARWGRSELSRHLPPCLGPRTLPGLMPVLPAGSEVGIPEH